MEKIKKTLEKIGLNEKEIKIYLSSLSIGEAPASILGKRDNIARSTANYTCQSLVDKGLMNVVQKGNTFLFSPQDPQKLLSLVNKEYEIVEKKFLATRSIMDDLQSLMNPERKLPRVKYFTGLEGLKEMFEDALQSGSDVRGFYDISGDINKEIMDYIKFEYIKKRVKKGIKAFSIFNDIDFTEIWKNNSEHREYKVLNGKIYPIKNSIQIYGGKVSFYSLKNDDLMGVIIENPYIYETQLALFQCIWDTIKE